MPGWKWLLVFFATGYLALVALMYVTQRGLMYFPETLRTAPADAGLAEAEEVMLDTPDGARVIVWHIPPRGDGPVWLYFHGNGGALRYRVDRFRELTAQGEGLVALSYRGYAGSTGRPSEAGLIADARAAYDFAVKRYGAERIVLWGKSLGTGGRAGAGRRASGRARRARGAVPVGRRYRRRRLSVPAGALADEGPVPFRPARRQGDGAGAGHARRSRQRRADRVRRTALQADHVAQALRPPRGRRA